MTRTVLILSLAGGMAGPACGQTDARRAVQEPADPGAPQASEYRGATALGLALRRLGPTGRVLMIGAHPDDEDTQLLARLALGEGADVAYLSLTRGEGGQNAIGPDFQEALGIIRTEELLAARRVDGARQFFGREYDYGYSKTADEAFQHWPHDTALADVVRVIRRFRPDVVISVWSGTPRDGHGQHQASGIVAKEAFAAAADSARFSDQLRAGLRPWQAQKLYLGGYFRQDAQSTRYDTGELDPLLGLSYAEVAAISRGRHRSQDMGRPLPRGPRSTAVNLLEDRTRPGAAGREGSIFTGIDTTLSARAAASLGDTATAARLLASYDSAAAAVRATLNPFFPDASVPLLAGAARLLLAADSALPGSPAGQTLRWYVRAELADAAAVLTGAERLVLDASSPVEQVAPGSTLEVTRTVWNGGSRPVTWFVAVDSAITVAAGATASRPLQVRIPTGAGATTEPYYLRRPRQGDIYSWPAGDGVDGLPFDPAMAAPFDLAVAGARVRTELEITHPIVSPTEGESYRPVRVVPVASVELDRAVAVRPLAASSPLTLAARVVAETGQAVAGQLQLVLPPGWSASPAVAPIQLGGGETHAVSFAVTPPAGLGAGSYSIRAVLRDSAGREYDRGFQLIDYPHIPALSALRPGEDPRRGRRRERAANTPRPTCRIHHGRWR